MYGVGCSRAEPTGSYRCGDCAMSRNNPRCESKGSSDESSSSGTANGNAGADPCDACNYFFGPCCWRVDGLTPGESEGVKRATYNEARGAGNI